MTMKNCPFCNSEIRVERLGNDRTRLHHDPTHHCIMNYLMRNGSYHNDVYFLNTIQIENLWNERW